MQVLGAVVFEDVLTPDDAPGGVIEPTETGWVVRDGDGREIGQASPLEADRPAWAAPVFGLELAIDSRPRAVTRYRPLPVTPSSERDVTLLVPQGVSAAAIREALGGAGVKVLESVTVVNEYRGPRVGADQRSLTFRLTFRTGTTSVAASGRHALPLFASRSLRVLLIDDDPALLESLRSSLQDEGHKVQTADGGQAGLDAFRDAQRAGKPFDIVITDLGMPYVDGRKVATRVRQLDPQVPIIMLTGWGHRLIATDDRPEHVDRVLSKPPKMAELRTTMAELLKSKSGH